MELDPVEKVALIGSFVGLAAIGIGIIYGIARREISKVRSMPSRQGVINPFLNRPPVIFDNRDVAMEPVTENSLVSGKMSILSPEGEVVAEVGDL